MTFKKSSPRLNSRVPNARGRVNFESLMHESESSPSHSVLESKSSHESLNLAHESDSSPSPGLEYYNTGTETISVLEECSKTV